MSSAQDAIKEAVYHALREGLSPAQFVASAREHWREQRREDADFDEKQFERLLQQANACCERPAMTGETGKGVLDADDERKGEGRRCWPPSPRADTNECQKCHEDIALHAPPPSPEPTGTLTRQEFSEALICIQEDKALPVFTEAHTKIMHHDAALRVRVAELEKQYQELLYAVGSKYPDETRHETALRYIRESERRTMGDGVASAVEEP